MFTSMFTQKKAEAETVSLVNVIKKYIYNVFRTTTVLSSEEDYWV